MPSVVLKGCMGATAQNTRKGKVAAFTLVTGDNEKVVRNQLDLIALDRQLNKQGQKVEFPSSLKSVDTSSNGFLAKLIWLAPACGAAVYSVCCEQEEISGPVAQAAAASTALLVVVVLAAVDAFLKSSDDAMVGQVEAYLRQAMEACTEGESSQALEAFLEAPLRPDWPGRMGSIDLSVHDLPHRTAQTEWWYYNCHIEGPEGRQLSLFVCFFRLLKHVDANGKRYHSHALTWALSDVENEKYIADVVLESDSPKVMLKALEEGSLVKDQILKRALKEVFEKGNVPLPDRLFKVDPRVDESSDELKLDYESATLKKDAEGRYHVAAKHYKLPCEIDLVFDPKKPAVRHGDHGVVKGRERDDMFYYCIPRCEVTGTVTVPKAHKKGGSAHDHAHEPDTIKVAKGQGWYDHEFGGKPEEDWNYGESSIREQTESGDVLDESDNDTNSTTSTSSSSGAEPHPEESPSSSPINSVTKKKVVSSQQTDSLRKQHMVRYAWNWVAAQLDDNTEVTAALLVNGNDGSIMEVKAIVVDEDGNRVQFDDSQGVKFTDSAETKEKTWGSVRTFVSYPTEYRLEVPGAGLDLTVSAAFGDQEFMTLIGKPAFWEGRCDVSGTKNGKAIKGLAYVERNGFNKDQSIKSFFKNVGGQVRSSVQAMYPLEPTYEEALELIATKDTEHYMKGVPLKVLGDTLIAPVRLIADRGGKSWRSYGALACVDCVGGDSRDFVDWLAMPEFLHVGSLIVDDIQDESETRRGGPAAHHEFGSALCINAGTAAYFQCEQMLKVPGLSPEDLNKCYALYFACLRGGHAGQALDINGLDYMMDDVVKSGEADLLEERILAIHMLKTAVPAGTLARMGALVGKGSQEQIEAMGLYFESIGVAFQIMDDVLNLRGLYSKESDKLKLGTALKRLGEDIVDGKVTFPVAKAMRSLSSEKDRRKLWDSIRAKPQDQVVVDKIIAQLEDLGAIDACVEQAENVVNEAWLRLDSVIPDSFAKMMLRSFGWFVIERIQ